MTSLLHFTINARKSHSQPQFTLQLLTFPSAGSSIQTESKQFVSCIQSFFCILCSPSNFTNKNLTQLCLEIQNTSILLTIQNEPHVHTNVLNHNGRYHYLWIFLTFLQNYSVYVTMRKVKKELNISPRQSIYYFQTVYEHPDCCP